MKTKGNRVVGVYQWRKMRDYDTDLETWVLFKKMGDGSWATALEHEAMEWARQNAGSVAS